MDFESLYRRTYPRVLSYARTVADRADADDVVAETYTVAWRRRDAIPADGELGWLIGVARRVIANRRRGERRLTALRLRLAGEPASVGRDPAQDVPDEALRAALLTLRPLEREALMLRAWFDLSPTEAAIALGVSPAAFRMRLTRARRQVLEVLEADPITEEEPRWNLI